MSLSSRFNLLRRGLKRDSEAGSANVKAKFPRVADIAIEEGPRPTVLPQRLPSDAPVNVCIYKYTDEASDLWNLFQAGSGAPLFQAQLEHKVHSATPPFAAKCKKACKTTHSHI